MRTGEAGEPESAYIALGSNLGNREHYLREALRLLQAEPAIDIVRCSAIYETDPVGYTEQDPFLNMTALLRTRLLPHQLLNRMQETENRLGRTRDIHWGPRTIDLDLLLYGGVALDSPELIVPHPRMLERLFVLVPLADIAEPGEFPNLDIPGQISKLEGKDGIRLWKTFSWPNA